MSKIHLVDSMAFPFRDERWWQKLFMGWLIAVVPILNFVSTGYVARIYKNRMFETEEILPEWDDWMLFLKEGLLINLIVAIYVFIPSLVLYVLFPTLPILRGALVIVVTFLVPMAIGYFVVCRTFRSAFAIKDIWGKIKVVFSDYFLMFVLMLGFGFILMIFVDQILIRKDIGSYLLFAGMQFYIQIVCMKMFGDIFPLDEKDWQQIEIIDNPSDSQAEL